MPHSAELFFGLNEQEKKAFFLRAGARTHPFEKGEAIFMEGDTPRFLYVLKNGRVMVDHCDAHGRRTVVNLFDSPGTVFGEVYLFLEGKSYDFACTAQEKSEIILIPKTALCFQNEIGTVENRIMSNLMRILSEKAYFLNHKILIMNADSLRQRIVRYILKNTVSDHLTLPFNREQWADFLGVTRPALSRELMRMRKDGLVEVERNRLCFDRADLEKIL